MPQGLVVPRPSGFLGRGLQLVRPDGQQLQGGQQLPHTLDKARPLLRAGVKLQLILLLLQGAGQGHGLAPLVDAPARVRPEGGRHPVFKPGRRKDVDPEKARQRQVAQQVALRLQGILLRHQQHDLPARPVGGVQVLHHRLPQPVGPRASDRDHDIESS